MLLRSIPGLTRTYRLRRYFLPRRIFPSSIAYLPPIICAQTRTEATKHYEAKVDYIRTNLEALQETIQKKQENMNMLIQILQMKLQQQASGGKETKAS